MLYGQKLKEILEKFGVDTNKLPNTLYSTMLDAIYNSDGGSGSSGGVNTPTLTLLNGDVIPNVPNEVRSLPFIIRQGDSGYELYASIYGFGKRSDKFYCLKASGNGLDGSSEYPYMVYKLNTKNEWVYNGSGYSQVYNMSAYPMKYTNHDIYNWLNLADKGTLYATKNG